MGAVTRVPGAEVPISLELPQRVADMAFALTMDKKDMMVFDTTQETMWTLNMDPQARPSCAGA